MDNAPQPQVLLTAAMALGRFGPTAKPAVPTLMKWLDHPTMREVVIDALGEIGPGAEPAIDLIASIAADPNERFTGRRKTIEAMIKIGGINHPSVTAVIESPTPKYNNRIQLAVSEALYSIEEPQGDKSAESVAPEITSLRPDSHPE